MKFAIVKTGGKQYKVSEGSVIAVDKLATEIGQSVNFDDVLFYAAEGEFQAGQPTLKNVKVSAKVLDQFKGEKIHVAKFKAKARYRRVQGFRAQLTKLQIEKITATK